MTLKPKYVWLGIGALAIAGVLIAFGFWWNSKPIGPANHVTTEACDRIQLGMTERQVESILGKPADRQYHPWDVFIFLAPAPGTSPEWEKMWIGEKEAVIIVHFDANGKVSNKAFSTLAWE
jgi:outer membrane protein assembly factor BamE (lipoprotein component of BamABCDE complex)